MNANDPRVMYPNDGINLSTCGKFDKDRSLHIASINFINQKATQANVVLRLFCIGSPADHAIKLLRAKINSAETAASLKKVYPSKK